MPIPIRYSPAVWQALNDNHPLLALESTLIAHGMPWPENVDTALELERISRDAGAEPATIAIMEGTLQVGLHQEQIELLGKGGKSVRKISRRDFSFALYKGWTGATTVAATMIGAHAAGIRVFATGGVGGVHRGASQSFDISADLEELARTPIAVVSAGAKSLLDLPLTMEYLETRGVPVVGYRCEELPAFYTRKSGLPLEYHMDEAAELAAWLHLHWSSGFSSGALVANPVPTEHEAKAAEIEAAIQEGIKRADKMGISGKALTPFVLATVKDLTEGRSLATNIALVKNNVRLGAEIAHEFHKL